MAYDTSQKTTLNFDNVAQAMKIHYKDDRVKEMIYKNNPLLAMLPKYESFGGLSMPIPLLYGNPQRTGATFKMAKEIESNTKLEQFSIERVKDYSFASIDGHTIKSTQANTDAFLRYLTMEIDGAIHSIKRRLAFNIYGSGGGVLGSTSAVASEVATLANPAQITNFEVGMWVTVWDTTGATARDQNTGSFSDSHTDNTYQVIGVDRDLGKVTLDRVPASFAATDIFVAYGDIPSTLKPSTAGDVKIQGLDSWVPGQAGAAARVVSLAASFNGVTRSTDNTRLGGIYYDGSAMPVEEALISAASRLAREGGNPDVCMVDFSTWTSLEKALGAKVIYTQATARDVDVGFNAIAIQGPTGSIKVVPDMNCQANTAWLLQMDTWKLNSLGQCPQILDLDNQRMLREADADSYEVRIGYYAQMSCNAPGWNAQVKL